MSRWRRPTREEQTAFDAFVVSHGAALNALARGLVSKPADAEDLLQETLAVVLERWERIAKADNPYSYVRRVMVNTSTSRWRRSRREQHVHSVDHVLSSRGESGLMWSADSGQANLAVEQRLEVTAMLRQLPQRQRAVIVLRYLEELPDTQIADLMGISPVTVRSTAIRALRSLRVVSLASR